MIQRLSFKSFFLAVIGIAALMSAVSPQLPTGASVAAGSQPIARLDAINGVPPSREPGASADMLQFKAGGHVVGFQSTRAYLVGLDHALSVEFVGTP
jgi:hypothetical protein